MLILLILLLLVLIATLGLRFTGWGLEARIPVAIATVLVILLGTFWIEKSVTSLPAGPASGQATQVTEPPS